MHFDSATFSSPTVIACLVIALILIVAAVAIAAYQRRKRTEWLRSRFGNEYDMMLRNEGSWRRAETAMVTRIRRIQHLKLRELTPSERARFISEWEIVQSRFVDQPRGAVVEADELINSILQTRGYPTAVFEQRAADISVHHCNFVGPYRAAHDVTLRAAKNEATTEELRNAILQYRALFDELLHITEPAEPRALGVGVSSHA